MKGNKSTTVGIHFRGTRRSPETLDLMKPVPKSLKMSEALADNISGVTEDLKDKF